MLKEHIRKILHLGVSVVMDFPRNTKGLLNKSRIRSDQGLSPFKSSFKAQKWGKIEQNPCTSLKATQENVSKVTAELDK